MLNIHHILFPIDFSERSCSAAPFVESVAKRYDAKVTIFSVAPIYSSYYMTAGDGPPIPVDTDRILDDLQTKLEGSLLERFSGLKVDRVAELGDPARQIVNFAHAQSVDLVMMPSHGYGPFRSLLLGSVTAKVLHDAHCPVWTATHAAEPPCSNHLECRNVLCAVDQTEESIPLMRWAGAMAADAKAALRLVHAIPALSGFPSHEMNREFANEMWKNAFQEIETLQRRAGIEAPLCIAAGDVGKAVHEEALKHNADLVVIGRGRIHETLGRLRTHAYGIIRHSPCPVLSV